MINFLRPWETHAGELERIKLNDRWDCTIGVVDTEIKPVWKINNYANS
jgi:hypothetical protein